MRYKSTLITGPVNSPIEVDLFEEHIRDLGCGDDESVVLYREAAVKLVEEQLGLALITQTWETVITGELDPDCYRFVLPRSPVQSVSSVKSFYRTTDTTLDSSKYWLLVGHSMVNFDELPAISYHGLKIRYVAGFGDDPDDVPQDIRQALLMLGAHFYEHRMGEGTSVKLAEFPRLPPMVETLLAPYRVWLT